MADPNKFPQTWVTMFRDLDKDQAVVRIETPDETFVYWKVEGSWIPGELAVLQRRDRVGLIRRGGLLEPSDPRRDEILNTLGMEPLTP